MAEAAGPAVLLADDEPMLLRLMQRVLEAGGFPVVTAADGEAALAAFTADPARIGVVVLDVSMPPDGAPAVLRRMLARRPDLGVVFTSGLPLEPDVEALLAARQGVFLLKPFSPPLLQRTVADLLHHRAADVASVVVVGGGIAGLGCAFRLQQRGHAVQVLERESVPGGRMRSERVGDYVVDRGAQFIASGYRNLHRTARELGIAHYIRPVAQARNAILRHGRLLPGDYDSPLAFLRSPLLSARAKLRLPRILWELWRHRRLLDPLRPERAASLDREDLARYLRRVVGSENLEYLFGPAFSSTFDSDPEDLSGAFGLLTLRVLLGGFRLQCFAGGMGLLTRTLAERLRVMCGCEVLAVETESGGARVRYRSAGREREALADAAVVAVPGSLVAGLCPRLTPEEAAFFGEVHYVRGIIVFLLLEKAPPTLPYYGVAFPRAEGIDLYGLAVDQHKAGVAPAGAGLVNVALTERAATRVWQAPDADVVEHVLAALARTPVGRLSPQATVVHRWDPMLPQFRAGYLPRLAGFLGRGARSRSPRLGFAGDYLVGPYTEAALVSGLRAADEIGAAGLPD